MDEIFIRPVEREDVHALLTFINVLSKEQTYIRLQGEELSLDDEILYIDDFLRKVQNHKAMKLLAFHKNELVGVADIYLKDKIESHIGVFGLTIKKEWRGKGIGRILMEKTMNEASNSIDGLKIIELGVFANNSVAKKLYEKMGFKEYGVLPRGISHKGAYVDHIYMYKEV